MTAARRVFLDSNVLLYAHSATDEIRREKARALADLPGAMVSTQVLAEVANVLLRKFALSDADVRARVTELARRCEVLPITPAIVLDAFRVREQHRLGFFDAQMVASAIAARASTLYSEDLHHGLLVDDVLRIVNPFRSGVEQTPARYRVRGRTVISRKRVP